MKTPAIVRLTRIATVLLGSVTALAACDSDDVVFAGAPELAVETSMSAFAATDPILGSSETMMIEARNRGGGEITLDDLRLEGDHAGDFRLLNPRPVTLGAGESATFEVAFAPRSEGMKTARLILGGDQPSGSTMAVLIQGRGAQFQYQQVDRMGIPGLNTVFNHPSGVAFFDKRAYNVASPASDLANYRDQFELVLGAVANPDPVATAGLLLPDELPVSMAAPTTAFGMLTGRALADDAVDVALSVTVGIGSLQSDNVDQNDKTFRADFPYLAPPHG